MSVQKSAKKPAVPLITVKNGKETAAFAHEETLVAGCMGFSKDESGPKPKNNMGGGYGNSDDACAIR